MVKLESATALLDGLNGVIWHRYGCQIQQVLRRVSCHQDGQDSGEH